MKRRFSLFRRTALTLAAGLLAFQLIAGAAVFINLVLPLAHRSADDMASLLLLASTAWLEKTPVKRADFEKELLERYGISLRETQTTPADGAKPYPYLAMLRTAIMARLPAGSSLQVSEDAHKYFHVEFTLEGRGMRFDFARDKISPSPSRALAWVAGTGILAILGLAWLLARRVTAPAARLAEAARRIGRGDQPPLLPETGEAEFADLARIFNETASQLQGRRENQTTLLAGVSHDLRSPLARMKMALGMLAEECPSPLLVRMERDIMEMDRLIGAQLELARAQEKEPPETTDIDALLAELAEAAEAQAPGGIRLRADGPACIEAIAPVALRRCLGNLMDNALRYGGIGKIELVRRRFGGAIFMGVRDRGPGIPPHLLEAVFRPFYRIESSRNRATGGSGLGLAITRQLAETQRWRVAFKPRHGGGLSAWMEIPCEPERPNPP